VPIAPRRRVTRCHRDVIAALQIGNGDVVDAATARKLLELTGCDGIMVGRGAISDPLVFHRIRASFAADQAAAAERRRQERQGQQQGQGQGGGGGGLGWERDVWPDEAEAVCSFLERYASTGPDGRYETAAAYVSASTGRGRPWGCAV
jgi:tRNA-dihydrouridine synthase